MSRPPGVEILSLTGEGSFLARTELALADLRGLIDAHDRNVERGETLKRDRATAVSRVGVRDQQWGRTLGVTAVVVKRVLVPGRRRLGRLLGAVSPFACDFEGYERLRRLGIESPRVLAASLRSRGARETLVTVALDGGRTLREWVWFGPHALDDVSRRVRLFAEVGDWLRRLHDAGVWHRDLKPNNVFVRLGDATELVLLDTTGLRISPRGLDEWRRARNLAQIADLPRGLDQEAEPALVSAYCAGGSRDPEALRSQIRRAVVVRRARRRRRCGFDYVDEEHFGVGGG